MTTKKESIIIPLSLKGLGDTEKDALKMKNNIKKLGKKHGYRSMAETIRFCVAFTLNNVQR